MKAKILLITAIAAAAVGLFFLIATLIKSEQDCTEYFTGYDDRISLIVEGYQMHWNGFSPEDLELSYIYKYESPYGGFVKHDLDGDGTQELLMGDQFENGDYRIYDIFTFDKTTGDIIHLFCGGERNWCTINGSGVIIETGSNSADDSFIKYHVLKDLKLKKPGKMQHDKTQTGIKQPVTYDLLGLDMDKFKNYAHPQHEMPCGAGEELGCGACEEPGCGACEENLCGGYTEQHELSDEDLALFRKVMGEVPFYPLSVATQVVAGLNYRFRCKYDDGSENSPGHCLVTIYQALQGEPVISNVRDEYGGPEMKVIIDSDGNVGRYIGENGTSYQGEVQDSYWIEKDKAETEMVKACEGHGILTLKNPGKKPVFSRPDPKSYASGTMIHEQGYIPEVYRCLGYIRGWFLADVDGKSGFIREELVNWDAIDTF